MIERLFPPRSIPRREPASGGKSYKKSEESLLHEPLSPVQSHFSRFMPSQDLPVSSIQDTLSVAGKFFRAGENICLISAVTFGPFPVGAFPDEGISELSRVRNELGANAIRVYEVPSLTFMHACAEAGLRVFITLPWDQHIDFLSERRVLERAEELLLETVQRFQGHPALGGYFVANEIETTLVRWMGPARVVEQIERLIDLGHANAPGALFSYANYPSTEYLLPQNQDFVSFNLYLESEDALSAYLARLQNLSGDKPLFISEFGADALAHGESGQAEILRWFLQVAAASGVAGATIFAWSDLWQRGGATVTDWQFGLTRADRSGKAAVATVKETWEQWTRPGGSIVLAETPRVSVIVCTYRGSATLVTCLDSLVVLDYPDYEVILVNDGGDGRVAELAATYESVRYIEVEHDGLSAARNTGAAAATGEIFVYTDDDCIAESDWLSWIVKRFESGPQIGCVGGPNIPPPAETATQALIAAAPGGPAHVLIDDTRAEHLPGCNLAVRLSVFEEVGGFNPIFRTAGDDVDFCWRVAAAGYDLGFHPAAFVWHLRRFSYRAYRRQQIGYGKAEAMLMPIHRDRFRGAGGAIWKGHVYAARCERGGAFVYHGRYGYEPFQFLYSGGGSGLRNITLHVIWWVVILGLLGASFFNLWFLLPAGVMALLAILVALQRAGNSVIESRFDTTTSRFVLAGLILVQGVFRSGTRLLYGWRGVQLGRGIRLVSGVAADKVASGWWKLGDERAYWSSAGVGREALIEAILTAFPGAEDDALGKTDVILKKGWFWNWAVVTATEYHESNGRLTRLRLLARPQWITRMIVLPLLLLTPVAVMLGYGFQSEFLTLTLIYASISIAAKFFMWMWRPRFHRIARSIGLETL